MLCVIVYVGVRLVKRARTYRFNAKLQESLLGEVRQELVVREEQVEQLERTWLIDENSISWEKMLDQVKMNG